MHPMFVKFSTKAPSSVEMKNVYENAYTFFAEWQYKLCKKDFDFLNNLFLQYEIKKFISRKQIDWFEGISKSVSHEL